MEDRMKKLYLITALIDLLGAIVFFVIFLITKDIQFLSLFFVLLTLSNTELILYKLK